MSRILVCGMLPFLALTSTLMATDILEATREGNLEQVRSLLNEDATSVNSSNDRGSTALNLASESGQIQIVKLLLDSGADIEAVDIDGDSPLMGAAYKGQPHIFLLLISRGANTAILNVSENGILHYAAIGGSVEIAQLALAAGSDINAQNYEQSTPLLMAAARNRQETVRFLIERGADTEIPNNYGRTPLLYVTREGGNVEMATLLLDNGANVNAEDRSGATPLGLATWRGFSRLTDLLLNRGALLPVEENRLSQMTIQATANGIERLFLLLVDSSVDLTGRNDNGGSLLHSACNGGSPVIVKTLISEGLTIDEQDRYGWSPLHYAAENGHIEAASALLQEGANVNIRSLAGFSAMNAARTNSHDEIVQLLEVAGASNDETQFVELTSPYLGQKPPGAEPLLFAPDIVASNRFEHGSVTFSPDGTEAYWSTSFIIDSSGYTRGRLHGSRLVNGRWTEPAMPMFSGIRHGDDVPFFSHDGNRLYFISRRPLTTGGPNTAEFIWYVDRTQSGWSEPILIDAGPNSMGHHWQFSVASNGNIYFGSGDPGGQGGGDIYVSEFKNDAWLPPVNLGTIVNTEHDEGSPFIASDESYLIFMCSGREDAIGWVDLYISFKDTDGNWMPALHLEGPINTSSNEICPIVTHDGKYFIFNSFRNGNADNYWVDASFTDTLRQAN